MRDLTSVQLALDEVTTRLLPPLRTSKALDSVALADLLAVGRDLADALERSTMAPRELVGKVWFVFTAMLTEADHAAQPEPILDAAWQWAELLHKAFGPRL